MKRRVIDWVRVTVMAAVLFPRTILYPGIFHRSTRRKLRRNIMQYCCFIDSEFCEYNRLRRKPTVVDQERAFLSITDDFDPDTYRWDNFQPIALYPIEYRLIRRYLLHRRFRRINNEEEYMQRVFGMKKEMEERDSD